MFTPPPMCPTGYTTDENGSCFACDTGYSLASDGVSCVPGPSPCPTGYMFDENGRCSVSTAVTQVICPPNFMVNDDGGCSSTCEPGYILNEDDTCILSTTI